MISVFLYFLEFKFGKSLDGIDFGLIGLTGCAKTLSDV